MVYFGPPDKIPGYTPFLCLVENVAYIRQDMLAHELEGVRGIIFGRPFVKRFVLGPYAMGPLSVCLYVCLSCLSVCNVGIFWPNGWIDQDKTLARR